MFKRVLIVEDHELTNFSVQRALEGYGIAHDIRNYVMYCDHALMRIKKALSENDPYELLITDLSFVDDFSEQQITNGKDLIVAARKIQPELKVLVFSVENRLDVAASLFSELNIDAYVPKGRNDAKDLKEAVEKISKDEKHLSPHLKDERGKKDHYELTPIEKIIVSLLYDGKSQKQIAHYLETNEIKPSSLSSIEKTIAHLKLMLNLSSTGQIIAYCRDKKII